MDDCMYQAQRCNMRCDDAFKRLGLDRPLMEYIYPEQRAEDWTVRASKFISTFFYVFLQSMMCTIESTNLIIWMNLPDSPYLPFKMVNKHSANWCRSNNINCCIAVIPIISKWLQMSILYSYVTYRYIMWTALVTINRILMVPTVLGRPFTCICICNNDDL